jgi:HEAT repeat protein
MIDDLISDLRSPDPLVRVQAAPRLGDLEAAAAAAIPLLLSLTQDETQHPLIRVMAATAVAKIDPAQTGAVIPVLINALNSHDAPLQGASADELGSLGKHAEPALPALFGLLTDDCAAVRATAGEAIWMITGDRTPGRQVGRALLRSEDWLDRQVGGSLLVLLGDESRS